jgi:hypothetical protein
LVQQAIAEHASIASFARLTLQLLALGGPPDLVVASQRASIDEVRHAQIFFELAARCGEPVSPGPLPMDGALASVSFEDLALGTFTEGCVAETIATLMMTDQARSERDPAVRKLLLSVARDELRHAELAWRILAWCVAEGGPAVRAKIAAAAGRPAPSRTARVDSTWDEVIAPALAHLLAPNAVAPMG